MAPGKIATEARAAGFRFIKLFLRRDIVNGARMSLFEGGLELFVYRNIIDKFAHRTGRAILIDPSCVRYKQAYAAMGDRFSKVAVGTFDQCFCILLVIKNRMKIDIAHQLRPILCVTVKFVKKGKTLPVGFQFVCSGAGCVFFVSSCA